MHDPIPMHPSRGQLPAIGVERQVSVKGYASRVFN